MTYTVKELLEYTTGSNTLAHTLAYENGKYHSNEFWFYVDEFPEITDYVTNKGFTPIVSFFAGLCGNGNDDHDINSTTALNFLNRYYAAWEKNDYTDQHVNKKEVFINEFVNNAQKAWIILNFNEIKSLFLK